MDDMASPKGGEQPEGSTDQQRGRMSLLERADLDSDSNDNEQLLSDAEYTRLITDEPKEFLREIRELIKQQRALNVAYAELANQVSDLTEKSAFQEEKLVRKDRTIVQMTEASLQSQGQRERSGTPFASDFRTKLAKISDPPFFSTGTEDKLGFDGWLIQVKNKLHSDEHMYPTESRKIVYVTGLLQSPAYDLISPRLDSNNPHAYTTIGELYEHMEELWSNPNKQKDARAAFRKLEMDKTDKFQAFYAEFSRLVAEGHIAALDLKDELYTKLWWKLQEAVAVYYNDDAYNLHRFSTMCATTDRQIRERLDRMPRPANKPKTFTGTAAKEPKQAAPASKPKDANEGGSGGSSNENSTDEGIQAMTCYNCQKSGHIARKCPEPLTEKRKRYLANIVGKFQTAKKARVGAEAEPLRSSPATRQKPTGIDGQRKLCKADLALIGGTGFHMGMKLAQERHFRQATKTRRPVDFGVEDRAWVSTKEWRAERPSKKLNYQQAGPYMTTARESHSFRLELPSSIEVHHGFHTSKPRKEKDVRQQKALKKKYRDQNMLSSETLSTHAQNELANSAVEQSGATIASVEALIEDESALIMDRILQANRTNQDLQELRDKATEKGETTYSLQDGLLLAKGCVVVPDTDGLRMLLIRKAHDQKTTAHAGRKKTIRVLRKRYYWKGLAGDTEKYVRNCPTCKRTHVPRDKAPGLLHSLPIPSRPEKRRNDNAA